MKDIVKYGVQLKIMINSETSFYKKAFENDALQYLDWYFYHNDGTADRDTVKKYEDVKQRLNDLEQSIDRLVKIIIYLFRKCKDDLVKEFKCDDNFNDVAATMDMLDKIIEQMNKEMPEPWYTYGFGGEEENV